MNERSWVMAYTICMRFEVPQFIEIEDKIFGPFTWKQFVYLMGGVGLSVVMFFTFPIIIFVLFGIPLAALAALLAFYPINNRPFSSFLEAVVSFYNNSRVYHWRKKSTVVYQGKSSAKGYQPLQASQRNSDINSLSRRLELNALQKDQNG